MKRVIIVHGWAAGYIRHWFRWLNRELTSRGYKVTFKRFPRMMRPNLQEWVDELENQVGEIDEDTIILGHSIGASAILHYLSQSKSKKKLKGVILVAPLVLPRYKYLFPTFFEPFNHKKARARTKKLLILRDSRDDLAPVENSVYLEKTCGAEIIDCPHHEHFCDFQGHMKAPKILEAVLSLK